MNETTSAVLSGANGNQTYTFGKPTDTPAPEPQKGIVVATIEQLGRVLEILNSDLQAEVYKRKGDMAHDSVLLRNCRMAAPMVARFIEAGTKIISPMDLYWFIPSRQKGGTDEYLSGADFCACEGGAHGVDCWHTWLAQVLNHVVYGVPLKYREARPAEPQPHTDTRSANAQKLGRRDDDSLLS